MNHGGDSSSSTRHGAAVDERILGVQVKQLSRNVSAAHLREIFHAAGAPPIVLLHIVMFHRAATSRGEAYVEFQSEDHARRAVALLDGAVIDGMSILCTAVRRRIVSARPARSHAPRRQERTTWDNRSAVAPHHFRPPPPPPHLNFAHQPHFHHPHMPPPPPQWRADEQHQRDQRERDRRREMERDRSRERDRERDREHERKRSSHRSSRRHSRSRSRSRSPRRDSPSHRHRRRRSDD